MITRPLLAPQHPKDSLWKQQNWEAITFDDKDKLTSNIKAMRIIRLALQSVTFCLVTSCTATKEIWDRLKELYSTDEDLERSIQTLLLSEFGDL